MNEPCIPISNPPQATSTKGLLLDLKQIKLIIDLMKRSELTEFSVEEEGFKLKICRSNQGSQPLIQSAGSQPPFIPGMDAPPPAATFTQMASGQAPEAAVEDASITYVKSPMVGTFYRSPSPETKAFAEPGTKISENSVVCIIEAMKIMNEIQAETKGTILEVLVENGQPVEYGQKLFKVKQG